MFGLSPASNSRTPPHRPPDASRKIHHTSSSSIFYFLTIRSNNS
nr:MAG TPA: hypothetical protein [Caudoviricetes sp.]